MKSFATVLRLLSLALIVVSLLHLVLGLGADALLGANIPAQVLADATLDSQNRFYGVAFALYAVVLFLCAGDLARFAPILRALLMLFFLSGLARGVSWVVHGAPAPAVIGLGVIEVVAPVALWLWFSHLSGAAADPMHRYPPADAPTPDHKAAALSAKDGAGHDPASASAKRPSQVKRRTGEFVLTAIDIAVSLTALSGATLVAFLGKIALAVVLGAVALGFFLRFASRRGKSGRR